MTTTTDAAHARETPRLPDRGARAPAPDDPLAVQQPRDLPAGARFQRLGRLRPPALRRPRRCGALRRRRRARDPRRLGPGRAHRHGVGQRHRHVARGGDRQHRHDREVRHARVRRRALGRRREGRAADRPVRRRLLLVVPRRRSRRARDAPRRRRRRRRRALESTGEGEYTIEPATLPGRGTT